MIATFVWLIVTSARNQLVTQIKRIKNPRYAIAMVLGIAYFYFIYLNPGTRANKSSSPFSGAEPVLGLLLPIGLVLLVSATWIFGAARDALAFTPAEVSMLFSAPVSRRALILYKLGKSQLAVLASSIIWVIIMRRSDQGPDALMRVLGFWVLISTVSFHRLGVALTRASQEQHGIAGWRKSALPILLLVAVLGAIASTLWSAKDALIALPFTDAVDLVVRLLSHGLGGAALYPFRVAVGPALATGIPAWLTAMGPAMVLLGLHAIWVLRSDAAFEEAAAEQSAKMAELLAARRARVGGAAVAPAAKSTKRTLNLAATGPRAVAILWKNTLYLMRTGQLLAYLRIPGLALIAAVVLAGRSQNAQIVMFAVCASIAVLALMFGPVFTRNDLRNDLLHLPMLKTLPVPGRQIVLAEVASGATMMTILESILLAAALISVSYLPKHVPPVDARLALMIVGPFVLLALNSANFTIHNGLALLFPAWVKLGGQSGGGFEAMGQMMITMIITVVGLALLLLLPAALGGGAFWLLRSQVAVAILATGAIASLVLAAEAYGLIAILGKTFESTEPTQVG